MARHLAACVLVLVAACGGRGAATATAETAKAEPAPAAAPDLADDARARQARDEARARDCLTPLSPLAARTPGTHRDDPVVHVGLEKAYEQALEKLPVDDPDRGRLLEAAAHRYVALEQWALRDLVRACLRADDAAADPNASATPAQLAAEIHAAREAMTYGRQGATTTCARLREEHPAFAARTFCATP